MGKFNAGLNGILRYISLVSNYLRKSCFRPRRTREFDFAVKILRAYLNTDESETIIFCSIFSLYIQVGERPVLFYELAGPEVMSCNPMYLLQYKEDLESLVDKGLLQEAYAENSDRKLYAVPPYVLDAIVNNVPQLTIPENDDSNDGFKKPEKIKLRNLYFSEEVETQLAKFTSYLESTKLSAIFAGLEKQNQSKGVCFAFYGVAASGKKSCVYNIAKQTNRGVYCVDIDEIEKPLFDNPQVLGALFDEYEHYCATEKAKQHEIPIFLLNSCDFLFEKKIFSPESEMDLAIKRLQEIFIEINDDFEGIMIVTTDVFDEAFENQFHYKLKFVEPGKDTKTKIWKNKLEWLDETKASDLTEKYEFNADEINNIIKKVQIDEIFEGRVPSEEVLEEYCKNEKRHHNGRSAGFLS